MVRPLMHPENSDNRVSFMSDGLTQLVVGPASLSFSEQMKVRSSTRATSPGSDRATYDLGRRLGDSVANVPDLTNSSQISWYSPADPSHHKTRSGLHMLSHSEIHASKSRWLLRAVLVVNSALPPVRDRFFPNSTSLLRFHFAFDRQAAIIKAIVRPRTPPLAARSIGLRWAQEPRLLERSL